MHRFGVALVAVMATMSVCAAPIEEFAWMSGCWSLNDAEAGSIEMWTTPAGGTMFGIGRTVKDGKTVAHEFMQIRTLDSGELAFVAKPSNQPEATFPLLRSGKNELVFENLAHDFPQRVSYRLIEAGVLHARIEGKRNGKERAIDYPMRRVECAQ